MKKKLFAIFAVLTLLTHIFGTKQVQANIDSPSTQNEFEHRHVIFLNGINSQSSDPAHPLEDNFKNIEGALREKGLNKIVYFSYAAATAGSRAELMCAAWVDPACHIGPGQQAGDLASLYLSPVYSVEDTKVDIDKQADALEWLVGQIVKQDAEAEIDLLGFSLGGIIATRWASRPSGSAYSNHVHGIATMGSPLGGIPLAGSFLDGCNITDIRCWFWKNKLLSKYGDVVAAQLQLPIDDPDASIIDDLRGILKNKSILFISIQSTDDFTVNGRMFPICKNLACTGGYDSFIVGYGSQLWPPHTKYHDESLGGLGIPTEPIYHVNIDDWLGKNHSATLSHPFTAKWILEMVLSPSNNNVPAPSTVTPVPSLVAPLGLYDASNSGFAYDIVQIGETAHLVFQITNTGQTTWDGSDFKFAPVSGSNLDQLPTMDVQEAVGPGETVTFEVDIPDVSGASIETIKYQMTFKDEPFGEVVEGKIFILPEQIKDIEDELRKKIDDWVASGKQELQELIDTILQEIQKAIEREVQKQIENFLRQCLGSSSLVTFLAIVVYIKRKSQCNF